MIDKTTNILLVEDNIDKQSMVVKGLTEISQYTDKTYNLNDVNITIDCFNLRVSSCLKDAVNYIEQNNSGDLITILDGSFPVFSDGESYENYSGVIFALEDRLGDNFLIPFSADSSVNKAMELLCKENSKIKHILSLKGDSKEAILEGIQLYKRL